MAAIPENLKRTIPAIRERLRTKEVVHPQRKENFEILSKLFLMADFVDRYP